MSRPDWCPQDVWEAVEAVGELTYGRHARGFIMWPLFDSSTLRAGIARAILAERERAAKAIDRANARLGSIDTPLMRGDNLAITLCSHFDDGGPSDDDTGWSEAAIAGYEQVIGAIQAHYSSAIRAGDTHANT